MRKSTKHKLSKQEQRELNMSLELLKVEADQDRHKVLFTRMENLVSDFIPDVNNQVKFDIILCLVDNRYVEKYAKQSDVESYVLNYLPQIIELYSSNNSIILIGGKLPFLCRVINEINDTCAINVLKNIRIHPELLRCIEEPLPTNDSLLKYPINNSQDIMLLSIGEFKFNRVWKEDDLGNLLMSCVNRHTNVLDLWPNPDVLKTIHIAGGHSTSICHHERQLAMCKQQQMNIALGG